MVALTVPKASAFFIMRNPAHCHERGGTRMAELGGTRARGGATGALGILERNHKRRRGRRIGKKPSSLHASRCAPCFSSPANADARMPFPTPDTFCPSPCKPPSRFVSAPVQTDPVGIRENKAAAAVAATAAVAEAATSVGCLHRQRIIDNDTDASEASQLVCFPRTMVHHVAEDFWPVQSTFKYPSTVNVPP